MEKSKEKKPTNYMHTTHTNKRIQIQILYAINTHINTLHTYIHTYMHPPFISICEY